MRYPWRGGRAVAKSLTWGCDLGFRGMPASSAGGKRVEKGVPVGERFERAEGLVVRPISRGERARLDAGLDAHHWLGVRGWIGGRGHRTGTS